jgi:hypothetical protein
MKRACPEESPSSITKRAYALQAPTNDDALHTMSGQHQRRMGAFAWIQVLDRYFAIYRPSPTSTELHILFERIRFFLSAMAADPDGSKIGRDERDSRGLTVVTVFIKVVAHAYNEDDKDKWDMLFGSLEAELYALVAPSTGESNWLNKLVLSDSLHKLPSLYMPLLRAANMACYLRYHPGQGTPWTCYSSETCVEEDGSLDAWTHSLFEACQNAYVCAQDTGLLGPDPLDSESDDEDKEESPNKTLPEWTALSGFIENSNLAGVRCCLFWSSGRVACCSDTKAVLLHAEKRCAEFTHENESQSDQSDTIPVGNATYIVELVQLHSLCTIQSLDHIEKCLGSTYTPLIPPLAHLVRGYLDGSK